MQKALEYLTSGSDIDPDKILQGALFEVNYDEMVIAKNIEIFSLCEHHVLPFFGKVHLAYIPHGKVIGLSKIPRIVDVFARRLQVQERRTVHIAETIPGGIQRTDEEYLGAKYAAALRRRQTRRRGSSARRAGQEIPHHRHAGEQRGYGPRSRPGRSAGP